MALPPVEFTEIEVLSIRALLDGRADAGQQMIGMNAIGQKICRVFDSPYVANGGDRDTFVMLGRHQVGVIITSTKTPRVLEEAQKRDRGELKSNTATRRNRP